MTFDSSLWQLSSPTPPARASLAGSARTEVAIVGGGFTGLSAALHLAQAGKKVTLLEARHIGFGGSGRNNGQVIPTLAAAEPDGLIKRYGETGERFVELVRDSASTLFDLVRAHNIDCDAQQTGWFQPTHSPAFLPLTEQRVAAWSRAGAPVQLLDRQQASALLGSSHWHGGMLNPTGGHIDPLKLARGLADVAAGLGVQIFENSPATRISRAKDGWRIDTPAGSLNADALLLASNAYTQGVAPVIRRSTVAVTAWQLATPPLSTAQQQTVIPARQAVSDTRGDLWYFRYTADNRLVTGCSLMLKPFAVARLRKRVAKRLQTAFAQLGEVSFDYIWNGNVGISRDFYPRFHRLGDAYFAFTGYNGRGVALAVALGAEMAALLDGAPTRIPFSDPATIPLHGLVRHVARARLITTRLNDRKRAP